MKRTIAAEAVERKNNINLIKLFRFPIIADKFCGKYTLIPEVSAIQITILASVTCLPKVPEF